MEWRQQTSVGCADAFAEAQRWIEEVTGKSFGCSNFRAALENGVLLCDLINQLKPGIIKRLNRLSTPIAGLDNVNVFLKACGKLGLNESQLFHPGDLQDLSTRVTLRPDESNRRLKNVLITIYWLGRKAHQDTCYTGPQLNFKAFEGLLGLALSKVLDEGGTVKDGWDPEREDCRSVGPSHKRGNSVDSVDSPSVYPNTEGFGSDAEAEQEFKMEAAQPSAQRSKGLIPPPILRRKHRQENGRSCGSPLGRETHNQVRPQRPVQVNPGWIWSKSLSDIPMVYPLRKGPVHDRDTDPGQEWIQENKEASGVVLKDSEAHWHDDLKKWKNRRRSTTSDLRTKSQDREHVINQMTNGAVADGRLKKDQQTPRRPSPAHRGHSDLRPHTRALLTRSYATEAPFTSPAALNPEDPDPTQSSSVGAIHDGHVLGEETHVALALDGAGVTTPSQDCPFSSQTQVGLSGYRPPSRLARPNQASTSQVSTPIMTTQPTDNRKSTSTWDFTTSSSRLQEESPKACAVEQGRGQQAAGIYRNWSSSASLPRGFRRSEGSSRLSSAITARPFGTKLSRVSSLKHYNVDHSDMRLSLALKPNSRRDFGFETQWDSTGARVRHIEPGSPAELCRLRVDDEIVAIDGVLVSSMNDNQWKAKVARALQNGTLTMDVRRYGNKDWSDGEQSRPQQDRSRRTLNLTPAASVLIGCADRHANGAASADTSVPKVPKFNGQTENVKQGKVMDGENGDGYRKPSKAYNKIIRRNQKRRAEFFKARGGSESAISDLQVPSLNPSSSSWSWDCEEDRRRQEKWQEEQERHLQEKYKQDQERLEAEWRKAQQDAFGDSGQDNTAVLNGTSAGTGPGPQPQANGTTNTSREEWSPEKDEQREAGPKPQTNSDCLSPAHRTKSLSTPVLFSPSKQTAGDQRKNKGQSVSKAELERQQILEEMKKRTQLLTDNSWIRQRSSSFYKEPACVGLPLKKHDSLDTLDVLHQSPASTAAYSHPRPHSAAAGYCVPSRNASSRYSTGAFVSQRSACGEYSHHSSVWAATDSSEELRLESKPGTPAESPAILNSSPLMPPPRDQQAVLHIAE